MNNEQFIRRFNVQHIITTEGIKANHKKIEAIQKFPIPKTQKEIKSFLGLCGFYRKFIPDFAKIAKPMTVNLKKGSTINSTDKEYLEAFEKLKLLITSDPILIYPNFEKLFSLTTNASNVGLGAVLSQNHKPICYASRTLNEQGRVVSFLVSFLVSFPFLVKWTL